MDLGRYVALCCLYQQLKQPETCSSVIKSAIQQRAMRTLGQKRMYESQIAQLAQQTFNMESAALATENLRNTMATVDAMKQANKELRAQYGKIDIDKIEVRPDCQCIGVDISLIS